MNRRILVSVMGMTLLAGCAGMHERDTAPVATTYAAPGRIEQDRAYMARVEQKARMRGIEVRWVHPPVLRTGTPPR